ncbi:DNA adenine methylase [Aphanothece sacrum]|uniref:site-specific DNA-methyltransferase (adenine-specific) n=1 Tax=Aphanothece sacrum FPU1 TaxID=1920663 RepID=A0A401IJZ1_APHSA|nr:Dam family site-specific DNA-(adenine-N6)-methyltransferase [Aphanothece sacrum]GBF81622.1 N6 adenine-specific DNA methyltransferase [Aphanothece sacrum FPU1]GBF84120.1 N6 adenine-specific DNA methyltransferase [Aphanothece sacrum FPU3]
MVHIIISPVLKWAGGKTQLLPEINPKYPKKLHTGEIKTYIEPFLGGGAVFFDIYSRFPIKKAYLFDKNIELIILYKVIQNDVNSLINKLSILEENYLSLTPDNRNTFYYQSRDIYNEFDKKIDTNTYDKDWLERAAFTVFLNRTCFNGLYRVNSKGHFNVPMGSYKNPKILNEGNLRAVNQAFKIAEIQHKDFSEALKYADESTFIYYDPPYRPISKTASFNAYSSSDFDDNEQRRLRDVFVTASNQGALQMLSNSDPTNYVDDTFFDKLYQEFNITRISASRMINSKGNSRGLIREILVFNY